MLFVYQSSLMENGIPYYSLEFNDDQKFELYAEEFNTLGVSFLEYPSVSRYGKIRYPFYIGIISLLMDFGSLFDGFHTFMPRLLNIYLLAVSLLMVDSIVRIEYSFSQKQMKCLFLTLSLFPNLYYIAGFTFRDTVCLFLGLCTVWASVNLKDNRHSKLFLYVVIFSSLVFQYHVRAMATLVFFVISGLYLADHMAIRYGKKIYVVYAMASMLLFVISFRTLASEVGWYVSNYDQYRGGSGNRLLRIPLLPFGVFVRGIYGFSSITFILRHHREFWDIAQTYPNSAGRRYVIHYHSDSRLVARINQARQNCYCFCIDICGIFDVHDFSSRHSNVSLPLYFGVSKSGREQVSI